MYILVIDEGTTSTRVNIVDENGNIIGGVGKPFEQHFPRPGWVEHNAKEIWAATLSCIKEALEKYNINPSSITAIGITNQRETTVLWERGTGQPIGPAIVWQCRRTAETCQVLSKNQKTCQMIQEKTGLLPDAYFSATKIQWYLQQSAKWKSMAAEGKLLFGTIDSWLIWNLTGGQAHLTDHTNASRTLIFNIHKLTWDEDLLKLFDIPSTMLPQTYTSAAKFGITRHVPGLPDGIPITGVVGDQQGAFFGQMCFSPGEAKNTYGTGCFLLMNTGAKAISSRHKILTTIGLSLPGMLNYALEGSVFIGGALIQWLRDELKIIKNSEETETLARSLSDNEGVYIVPAFVGLGAPYWDSQARGTIFGLTRGTGIKHFARAALESIAYQVRDVLLAMEDDAKIKLNQLKVDGGAAANNFLLQFQSDILETSVLRPSSLETTSLGAAYLAGIGAGVWKDITDIKKLPKKMEEFRPKTSRDHVARWLKGWENAVQRTLTPPENPT